MPGYSDPGFDTLALHAGAAPDPATGARAVPIHLSTSFVFDSADHAASLDGQPLQLTRREFDLLWMLASHRGRLVTQEMILKAIWGPAHIEDSQYLRVYIRQLRQKLGDDAANPRFIATEPGIGYRFLDASDA